MDEEHEHRGENILWNATEKKWYVQGHEAWGLFATVKDAEDEIDKVLGPRQSP